MTTSEVSNGLVLPYAAMTIAGKGGAAASLLITFMACTSTLSAQVIAVSSILSFDVYREYFKKSASDRDLIRSSHFGVIFFAAFSAAFSTMLHYVGIDLGWTLYMLGKSCSLLNTLTHILLTMRFTGVVTCPGIFPMVFTILWRHQSKAAAILSPIMGMITGLAVWLGTAAHFGGEVSVATTGEVLPCMYGTVASCFSPIVYSLVITAFKPQRYDWADFKKEKLALEKLDSNLTTAHHDQRLVQNQLNVLEDGAVRSSTSDAQELKRWGRIAAFWSIATFLGHWVIWPLPMYGSGYIFEKKVSFIIMSPFLKKKLMLGQFFIAWVVVAIIWLWGTMLIAIVYPLVDGGIQQMLQIYRGLTGHNNDQNNDTHIKDMGANGSPSSPSAASVSDEIQEKE